MSDHQLTLHIEYPISMSPMQRELCDDYWLLKPLAVNTDKPGKPAKPKFVYTQQQLADKYYLDPIKMRQYVREGSYVWDEQWLCAVCQQRLMIKSRHGLIRCMTKVVVCDYCQHYTYDPERPNPLWMAYLMGMFKDEVPPWEFPLPASLRVGKDVE